MRKRKRRRRRSRRSLWQVRHLTRELRLQMLIIDNFVPADYQELVGQLVQ